MDNPVKFYVDCVKFDWSEKDIKMTNVHPIIDISIYYFQSCSKRKRSARAYQLTNTDDRVFSTSKMLHILPGANGATTTIGTKLFTQIEYP